MTGNSFYLDWEPKLMEWLQQYMGKPGTIIATLLTMLGEEMVMVVLLGFIYWCYDKKLGKFLGTNIVVALVWNPLIKNVVLRTRPYFNHKGVKCLKAVASDADIYDISAQGYSFPSGHSTNAATMFGSIAVFKKTRALIIIGIVIPLLIGVSRVMLGVHYPTDVLVGWALGAAVIIVVSFLQKVIKKQWLLHLILFLTAIPGCFYCKTTDYYSALGIMAGFFLAVPFEEKYVKFENTKKVLDCVLRIVGGLVIYLVLNSLLKLPFSKEFLASAGTVPYMIRAVRYMIVVFILLGVYPMSFKFNKKVAAFCTVLALSSLPFFMNANVVKAEFQAAHIVSEKEGQPAVGEKLFVDVEGDEESYAYAWVVGNKVVSQEKEYTPSEADCEKWISVYVYEDTEDRPYLGKDSFYFSKLPVVYINTDDKQPVTDKENYKSAKMTVQGNAKYKPQYTEDDRIQIKGRGNFSFVFPQKPYKIKLEKKSNMFGMGKNKHWVFISDFLDECCMRNITATNLAKQFDIAQMDMEWVDVIFNGKYAGTYIFSEHIRIGDTRVNIKNWEDIAENAADDIYKNNSSDFTKAEKTELEDYMTENLDWIMTDEVTFKSKIYKVSDSYSDYGKECSDITGGYLLEMSTEFDQASQFISNLGTKIMVNKPEFLATNSEMFNYIKDYWNDFEEAAYSINGYNSKGKSVYELADIDSMVGYWLTMEIMGNDDAYGKSRYTYKDTDGKFKFGPVWDFDFGCASRAVCDENTSVAEGWKISNGSIWKDWVDDPYFLVKAVEAYWNNHEYLEELVKESGIIAGYYNYINESGNAFYKLIVDNKWDTTYRKTCKYPMRGFEKDYIVYSKYMKDRIEWLDKQFKNPQTLSASIRSFSEHKYTRSSKIFITLNGETAGIDYVCDSKANMPVSLNVQSESLKNIEMYVNGIFVQKSEVTNGKCEYEVPIDACDAAEGTKNVVSFIGYDDKGVATETTYVTVMLKNEEETTVPEVTTASEETTAPEVTTIQETSTEKSTQAPTMQVESTTASKEIVTSKPADNTNQKTTKALAKAKIKRVTKKKKYIKISLKKLKPAKGYRIAIYKKKSDAKKNKKAIYKKNTKNTKYKVKKKYLKHIKKVYIRVRGYVINSRGKKDYGAWSKIRKVKIKY